ncbi:MAG: 4-amino-4-deoxy-L-arabinose transferase, partial [Bacteroidota bacterium]|nr:4-amino-4-deoxy-L-arabinose transferase [Bacteroidota bacterium]
FFFISSFNRRVQAQWTIVISIPLAVIAFEHLLQNAKSRKWMYRIGLISAVLLMYARAWMIYYPLFPMHFETHGNKKWTEELKTKSNGVPVVFENSYRRSSMYAFYTGVPAISLNNFMYRKNQYSIDGSEEQVRGKKVLYVTQYRKSGDLSYMHLDSTVFHGVYINNFQSYRRLECIVEKPEAGIVYSLKVYNPYPFEIPLEQLKYTISYSNEHKQVQQMRPLKVHSLSPKKSILQPKDTISYTFELPLSKMENPAYFRIGIAENDLPPGLNGQPIKID